MCVLLRRRDQHAHTQCCSLPASAVNKAIFVCFQISRESIDAVKDYFRKEMTKPDWMLIMELKKLFQILWARHSLLFQETHSADNNKRQNKNNKNNKKREGAVLRN